MEAVHIIGVGGIGCAIGHALCTAGVQVTFVDTDAAKIDWGRRHGVRVDDLPPRPATFLAFSDWRPPADGMIFLCTKCYDNAAVLEHVPHSAHLVPIQNGFDPLLQARGHIFEGIASFVSECVPHRTHTRITRRGKLHFGYRLSVIGSRPVVPRCIQILACSRIRVEIVADILPYKYTKLMYNAAIGPLASAAGLDNGQLLRRPRLRGLFFDLLRENYTILASAGLSLGKIGPFHPATVAAILRRPLIAHALAWAFYPSLRGTYCSMAADLPTGRTEIDYYNGHLIELAGDLPCPLNRRVYALIEWMQRAGIAPSVDEVLPLADAHGSESPASASGKIFIDNAPESYPINRK